MLLRLQCLNESLSRLYPLSPPPIRSLEAELQDTARRLAEAQQMSRGDMERVRQLRAQVAALEAQRKDGLRVTELLENVRTATEYEYFTTVVVRVWSSLSICRNPYG